MIRAVIIGLSITSLLPNLAICDGENDEMRDKRFLIHIPDFLNPFVVGPALINTLVVTSGYLTLHAFELAFNRSCSSCKCYGVCEVGYIEAEKAICGEYWTSINCAEVTTPSSPLTSAATPTLSPQHTIPGMLTCSKFCSVASVAKGVSISNPNATECPSLHTHASPEAFPMSCCSSQKTSTQWIQGPQVIKLCDTLPHYTAIGKFVNGLYVKSSAAIAIECLKNGEHGIQAIHQTCSTAPNMVHISNVGPEGFQDPHSYYVITTN